MTYQEELDARYEAWQREQTLASLDDCGITLPMDTSSAAWRRDYGQRRVERNPFDGVIVASVMSLLFWTPLLAYIFRKPILHFFGVNA